MNTLATRFLNAPPAKWNAILSKYNERNTADMTVVTTAIRALEGVAVSAARAAVYLQIRYITGFSSNQDGAHAKAVKFQNQAAAKVRRALGYTDKHSDIAF